jgi:hypothetical protein
MRVAREGPFHERKPELFGYRADRRLSTDGWPLLETHRADTRSDLARVVAIEVRQAIEGSDRQWIPSLDWRQSRHALR